MSDIREKIKGLLNIAKDDAASEHEVETALRLATRLMEKNQLSEEDLVGDPVAQRNSVRDEKKVKQSSSVGTKIWTWETILSSAVQQVVPGVGVFSCKSQEKTPSGLIVRDEKGEPKKVGQFVFFGSEEDVEIAIRVFSEVRLAVIALARLKYGSVFRGDGAAYAEGFCTGLYHKLKSEKAAELDSAKIAASNNQPNGLILIERRNDLIKAKIESSRNWLASPAGGSIRLTVESRSGSSGSSQARSAGVRDGSKYQVDGARRAKLC